MTEFTGTWAVKRNFRPRAWVMITGASRSSSAPAVHDVTSTLIANELCQSMSDATHQGFAKMKRLVRYLKCERQLECEQVTTYPDSDRSDEESLKIVLRRHCNFATEEALSRNCTQQHSKR